MDRGGTVELRCASKLPAADPKSLFFALPARLEKNRPFSLVNYSDYIASTTFAGGNYRSYGSHPRG